MRIILQRVTEASVEIGGQPHARIGRGLLLLVGFRPEDGPGCLDAAAERLLRYRVFPDAQGKINRSLLDVDGELPTSACMRIPAADCGRVFRQRHHRLRRRLCLMLFWPHCALGTPMCRPESLGRTCRCGCAMTGP